MERATKSYESWRFQVLIMPERIHLIMIVIIKKGENVNVQIHGFDDAKE